jgi:Bacterial SH3 domain/Homeodomain-like domain
MPRAYDPDLRSKALEAVREGERKTDVCRICGIHASTLNKWIKDDSKKKHNQITSQILSDSNSYSSSDFDLFELIKYSFFGLVFIVVIGSLGQRGTGKVSNPQFHDRYKREIDTSSSGSIDANVRITADVNSKKITTVENGEEVTVTEESGRRCKVTLSNGTKGWVACNFVKKGR